MESSGQMQSVLFFLLATALAVPLFRRIGLGAILGYLCAGVLIGPQALALIADPHKVLQFAEFGVILLLFIIGLELNPNKLWEMRRQIAVIGGGQTLITAALVAVFVVALMPLTFAPAMVIGLGLALSSTAFALQVMAEKGMLASQEGRRGFAILLLQDLAVIPVLFLVQGLATTGGGAGKPSLLLGAAVVLGLLLLGRFLLNPMLGLISRHGNRDSMTAMALLIVVGAAWLMELAHLSMGLGAFIAGIMLANSSFRHQLEAEIEPFKGLTLGLFFIAVGMTLDLALFLRQPLLLLALALALMLLKTAIIAVLLRISGISWQRGAGVGVMLSQGGEFGFVVMTQAAAGNVLSADIAGAVTLVIGLSMAMTSPLVLLADHLISRQNKPDAERDSDVEDGEPEVLILGFGRFGQATGRILAAHKIPFTALDKDAAHIDFVRRFGSRVFFGDATRMDLLEHAGLDHARAVLIALDDPDASGAIVSAIRHQHPKIKIIARARNRADYLRLKQSGADHVIREMFSGALEAATDTLTSLGYGSSDALHTVALFRDHDDRLLQESLAHTGDMEKLIDIGVQGRAELETLFMSDRAGSAGS